jgi:hypothetical protein
MAVQRRFISPTNRIPNMPGLPRSDVAPETFEPRLGSSGLYPILAGIVSITSPVTGSILRTGDAAPCDPYHCFMARFSAALAAACQPLGGFRYFTPPDIGFLFRI